MPPDAPVMIRIWYGKAGPKLASRLLSTVAAQTAERIPPPLTLTRTSLCIVGQSQIRAPSGGGYCPC